MSIGLLRCRTGNAAEPDVLRRLIMLICAGWLPQFKCSSQGCLGSRIGDLHILVGGHNVFEDSPVSVAASRSPSGIEWGGCRVSDGVISSSGCCAFFPDGRYDFFSSAANPSPDLMPVRLPELLAQWPR